MSTNLTSKSKHKQTSKQTSKGKDKHMADDTSTAEASLKPGEQTYKVRCLASKNDKTKKAGLRMFTQEFEITEDSTDGLNGVKIPYWCVMHPKMLRSVNDERSSLGLPKITSIDQYANLDPLEYVGLTGYVTAKEEHTEKKNEVTGEAIVNPNTGKPMTITRKTITGFCARE